MTIYACCNENRKAAILGNPTINGIDYLEVLDHDAIPLASPRQRTLLLHFLNPIPKNFSTTNILITGGESITNIAVQWVPPATNPPAPPLANAQEAAFLSALPDAAKVLVVRVNEAGDFSPYKLRLVNDASQAREDSFELTETLAGFDPELSEVQFSFKVECGPDFDCAPPPRDCPPDLPEPPPINYLAKDYGSFRSILLDRLNQLLPNWGAATEADQGVVLAELVAYVGDYLSYQQDAVATEAYIETARSRISLRRHALLVDYTIHDGCNARTWIHLEVNAQAFLDQKLTRFYTFAPGMPSSLAVGAGNEEAAIKAGVVVFQPMQNAVLYLEHNQMNFYTWGDTNCCLPRGTTEATLLGSFPNLQPGDVLIFEEVLGPQTGNPADADIRHRHAVRLTQVTTQNSQGQPLVDPSSQPAAATPSPPPRSRRHRSPRSNGPAKTRCPSPSASPPASSTQPAKPGHSPTSASSLATTSSPTRASRSPPSLSAPCPSHLSSSRLTRQPTGPSIAANHPVPPVCRFATDPSFPIALSPRPSNSRWPARPSPEASYP